MSISKLLVQAILEKPLGRAWSLQGLGMLRLYLSNEVRLHVWDERYAFPGASPLHTHPWNFQSRIIAGHLTNTVVLEGVAVTSSGWERFNKQLLQCGPEGCLEGSPKIVGLRVARHDSYREGDVYTQGSEEIHMTSTARGTVTIVERYFKKDRDHAYVYWRENEEWGTAEPRLATDQEVAAITSYSLATWFE